MCVRGGAEFTTSDPEALARQLEEHDCFRRDGPVSGIFHPGKICFREIAARDSLHIFLTGDHIVVHVDQFAPFSDSSARGRYTPVAVGRHLFATAVGLLRRLRARGRKEYGTWFGSRCIVVEDDGVGSSERFRALDPAGVRFSDAAHRSPPA
jgi:hypothetical protein